MQWTTTWSLNMPCKNGLSNQRSKSEMVLRFPMALASTSALIIGSWIHILRLRCCILIKSWIGISIQKFSSCKPFSADSEKIPRNSIYTCLDRTLLSNPWIWSWSRMPKTLEAMILLRNQSQFNLRVNQLLMKEVSVKNTSRLFWKSSWILNSICSPTMKMWDSTGSMEEHSNQISSMNWLELSWVLPYTTTHSLTCNSHQHVTRFF